MVGENYMKNVASNHWFIEVCDLYMPLFSYTPITTMRSSATFESLWRSIRASQRDLNNNMPKEKALCCKVFSLIYHMHQLLNMF
jgi:hypothetical protein